MSHLANVTARDPSHSLHVETRRFAVEVAVADWRIGACGCSSGSAATAASVRRPSSGTRGWNRSGVKRRRCGRSACWPAWHVIATRFPAPSGAVSSAREDAGDVNGRPNRLVLAAARTVSDLSLFNVLHLPIGKQKPRRRHEGGARRVLRYQGINTFPEGPVPGGRSLFLGPTP
jgi:hypothetical protein